MIRNLKVLGVLAAALMAFTAFGVASASATDHLFHSAVAHTTYKAEQVPGAGGEQKFNTPAGNVTCKKVVGEGTTTATTTTEITATGIKYSECKTKTIFGEIEVTVDFKGCDYLFTPTQKTNAQGVVETLPTHIMCPAGSGPITIAGPGCTITVGAQTVKQVHYHTVTPAPPGKKDVVITPTVTNIHSVASGFFCSSTGTSTTGTYSGEVTVRGFDTAGNQVDVWYTP